MPLGAVSDLMILAVFRKNQLSKVRNLYVICLMFLLQIESYNFYFAFSSEFHGAIMHLQVAQYRVKYGYFSGQCSFYNTKTHRRFCIPEKNGCTLLKRCCVLIY